MNTIYYKNNILSVIVLYKNNLNDSVSFKTLSYSLSRLNLTFKPLLLVYDNSPYEQKQIVESPIWDIIYISDITNPGVSKAYNYASKIAINNNKEYILLLDQDTYFPYNAYELYLTYSMSSIFHEIKLYAPVLVYESILISPFKSFMMHGYHPKRMPKYGLNYLNNFTPINSGLMINLESFNKIGGYNENLKLDFTDIDFISRFKRVSNLLYIVPFIAKHELSSINKISLKESLLRYEHYIDSILNMKLNLYRTFFLKIICLYRGIKLTLKFKSLSFFFKSFNTFKYNSE